MEKKRKCNNQCNIGDGIDFHKYEHIWGKSKKYDRQFSVAEIHSSAATPNKVWHTTCKYCSYNNNNIQFHLENEDQKTTFDNIKTIGSSRHASLALDPDICMITHEVDYSGKGLSFATDCERVISIPTFILPVWSITNVFHLYADLTTDGSDDSADDTGLGSSVRFADVIAPPHWADRITGLVAAISAEADT